MSRPSGQYLKKFEYCSFLWDKKIRTVAAEKGEHYGIQK
jgi:hypothetical protein